MESDPEKLFHPRPVTLTGKVARLEPLGLKHASDLHEVGADGSIWRFSARPVLSSVADTEGWILECMASVAADVEVRFAVVHLETGKALGSTAYIEIVRQHRTLVIGMTWFRTA